MHGVEEAYPFKAKFIFASPKAITTVCVVYIPFAFGKFYTGTGFIVFIVRLRKELEIKIT